MDEDGLQRSARAALALRCLCGWGAFCCATYSFGKLPLGDATAITFSSPAYAAVFGRLILGEALEPLDVTAIGDAVISVRDEPERWAMLGEAARAQAFSWAATGQRIADIFDEVAA